MSEHNITPTLQESAGRQPDLQALDRLVGAWQVSGGAQGTVKYEWMQGGMFLLQHVELNGARGLEIIGHELKFGEGPSADIKSRYYDYGAGYTFDYVYELNGDTLTIWGGERGSPAYYKGEFSQDGNVLTGAWVYPDGGGYESTSTRVAPG
jgi:hypothetical protein